MREKKILNNVSDSYHSLCFSPIRMDELEEEPDEQELPVQGPLPYEPDDAPWKRTNDKSGVRKLYVFTKTTFE